MSAEIEFHNVRFPTDIAFGSSGGPQRSTEIVTLGSGHERRNQRWHQSRRKYDAGYGVKHIDSLHRVIEFFEARRGALYGFRYHDPLDGKSCLPDSDPAPTDQVLGTGDGDKEIFQLTKFYGDEEGGYQRAIHKPVTGTVLLAVDNAVQVLGLDYLLDEDTGECRFLSGSIPAVGSVVTAGFEFDVPVRFATDQLTVNVASFAAGEVPSIPLIEILQ